MNACRSTLLLYGGPTAARLKICCCLLAAIVLSLLSGCQQEPARGDFRLGDPAPDFAARDLDGGVVVLSSLRGKPVILRFFETDCRFCRADTPVITELYQKYREQGLVILYIGSFYDKESSLRAFIDELGIDFPVVMDGSAKLADLYQIKVYPQTLFISPDQRLLGALLGAVGEAEVVEIFAEHLQQVP
jgi:peroxiredoxin